MTSKTLMRLAILLLLGLLVGAADDTPKVYVGELRSVSRDRLEIERNDSLTMIGFIGEPAALAQLDDLKVGDEVRAVFGAAPNPNGNGRINKLLSIRRCAANDAQCVADGLAQDAKDAEANRQIAISQQQSAQCRRDMDQTLLGDPRYAPRDDTVTRKQAEASRYELEAIMRGPQRACASAVFNAHNAAVYEACQLHHCGDNVGGGCAHIAGRGLTDAVIARAVATCSTEAP